MNVSVLDPHDLRARYDRLRRAALATTPVSGLTHSFYHYPARFSPQFAAEAIALFSDPGDIVLDPFAGGGTALLEAMANGRTAVGSDLNELAAFVMRVKTTPLTAHERLALVDWSTDSIPALSYRSSVVLAPPSSDLTGNLGLPHARPIKKLIALVLQSIGTLPTQNSQALARCALLRLGQWALNGRRRAVSFAGARDYLQVLILQMVAALDSLQSRIDERRATIHCANASRLPTLPPFTDGDRANLVVTSPPYPGIHVLYHRWQVDGRKETAAPYWISATRDGKGTAFYNFANRFSSSAVDTYFAALRDTFSAVRDVIVDGGVVIQMVAFGHRSTHMPRYLATMRDAGFEELRADTYMNARRHHRIWRTVPGRRWHASIKGTLSSSREVVLLHRAT